MSCRLGSWRFPTRTFLFDLERRVLDGGFDVLDFITDDKADNEYLGDKPRSPWGHDVLAFVHLDVGDIGVCTRYWVVRVYRR